MGGIYQIFCKSNHTAYIGSAKSFNRRWAEHRALLNSNKHHNIHLQSAWNKYNEQNFDFCILEEILIFDKQYFYQRENFWMDNFVNEDKKIFNLVRAGGGWNNSTYKNLKSISEKISLSLRDKASRMSKEERNKLWGSGRRGKPLSEDHKRKTSEGLKGKLKSKETRIKMSIAQKNANSPFRRKMMSNIGKNNKGKTPVNANKFKVFGIEYNSGAEVMRALNITSRQLHEMVLNGTATKEKKKL